MLHRLPVFLYRIGTLHAAALAAALGVVRTASVLSCVCLIIDKDLWGILAVDNLDLGIGRTSCNMMVRLAHAAFEARAFIIPR